MIADETFAKWYSDKNFQNWDLSPDEKFVLVRKNYMKQWRHSFFADYYVYDIENAQEVAVAKIKDFPQTQYAIWSPTGHILAWVSNDKNIYYQVRMFHLMRSKLTQIFFIKFNIFGISPNSTTTDHLSR